MLSLSFFRNKAAILQAALCAGVIAVGSTAAADEGITVYNAQHESLIQSWVEGFTKETGIKVTVRNGKDSELGNQLIQEGAASPADVFLTENSPAMVQVDKAKLLAPLDPATVAQVDPAFRPAKVGWVGIAARATVFVYNKDKVKADALPVSLLDLARPEWKGRWAASPSGADFQAIVGALLALKGEEATRQWLKAMKTNALIYKGNRAVLKAVNAGEVEGGVIYHYYSFTDQARTGENSQNVALHYFKHQDPGAFVSISAGGVLATSKQAKAAQSFLKWITGKEGQAILKTKDSFEYAVGLGADSHPKLPPVAQLEAPKLDAATLDSRKVIELMTDAGLL